MKLGGFGLVKDYEAIQQAGFDYAELDVPEINALDDAAFAALQSRVEKAGLPLWTGVFLLPNRKDPMIFVPGFRETDLEACIRSTCKRSALLGVKAIVFGHGKARSLVDEDSLKREHVFISFLRMACDIAGENGQELLMEPLGPKYSNYINTLPEAARVIDAADMPNLFSMADLRHMVWAEEPFEDISRYREIVHHVHVDYPLSYPERRYPNVRDGYDYAPFFSQLAGYDGTLTIEADFPKDWISAGKDGRELLQTYQNS